MKISSFLSIILAWTFSAHASYLDRPYKNLVTPIVDQERTKSILGYDLNSQSNTEDLIALQTTVKSQGKRGTCAIFSTTAMLESMLVIKRNFSTDIDLSEEWLEYLAIHKKQDQGSNVYSNILLLKLNGIPYESSWPYIGETWSNLDDYPLAQERCGNLTGKTLTSCLLAHRNPDLLYTTDEELSTSGSYYYDPEFLFIRREAKNFRNSHIQLDTNYYYLGSVSDIKRFLRAGIPVVIALDFFYEAWNHRKTENLGLKRNWDHWYKGIVGYPEPGSLDYILSPQKAAGHSVLIIGYDDSVVVERTVEMVDGSTKTFKYTGVYYFKNSWGTEGFGRDFELNGKNYPGYGMITQKYAHTFGGFFHLPLRKLR